MPNKEKMLNYIRGGIVFMVGFFFLWSFEWFRVILQRVLIGTIIVISCYAGYKIYRYVQRRKVEHW